MHRRCNSRRKSIHGKANSCQRQFILPSLKGRVDFAKQKTGGLYHKNPHSTTLLPYYRSCRYGTSFVRSDKGCKTLFRCKESESGFADATSQVLSNQRSLPLIKISPNLRAQHFSSSAFTLLGCSTAQLTARSAKETAQFYVMSQI